MNRGFLRVDHLHWTQPPGFCEAFWHTKKHLAAIIGLSNSREHLSGLWDSRWALATHQGHFTGHVAASLACACHPNQDTSWNIQSIKHKKAYIYIYFNYKTISCVLKSTIALLNLITVVNLEHVLAVLFPVARHLKWGTSSSPAGPGPPRKPRRSRPKWGCWMRAIHLAGMARTGFSLMISLVLFSSAPKPDTTGGYA